VTSAVNFDAEFVVLRCYGICKGLRGMGMSIVSVRPRYDTPEHIANSVHI
jgi:hypothetical protein